ncbi:MAG: tRNA (adenosine(37)-N6)-threonylcarbamoyltransferase complex dimerization subunit type 1 TsaB [Pirellulales bacterium]|nr:tRNA (adenosine(37)-N6)-threonylcarbamoyltransferase complex dimerization subunit type 1 TsaB [Pirellulales bacterium]
MKILALETTELAGSLAAMDGGKLLLELALDHQKQSACTVAPGIRQLLADIGWKPRDVDLVAVTVGPGSFTGLRVGLATAKTFAYCVQAGILGVGTLETVAAAAPDEVARLSIAVDAQRGQVVAGEFCRDGTRELVPTAPAELLDAEAWLSGLPGEVWASGPALRRYAGRVPSHARLLPREYWSPSAAQVARLAARDWAAGRRDDLWTLLPIYSRLSAAEEKWDSR